MPCIYSNVYIGNCRQLYKFIRNNNLSYSLKVYYKVNGHYYLQPTPEKYKTMSQSYTNKLIQEIKLNQSFPPNF